MAKPNRGDSAGWQVSTWVCAYGKCLLWNPSVTASPCQLPLAREPCGQCPLTISHGSFLRFVTSLTRPVSFYGAIPGFFRLSIDSVGNKHSQNHNPKRGQGLKPRTRAKAKGQSSDGSTRGILKGGIIRAGASYPPLEPDNFPYFLAGGRKEGPAGKRPECLRCQFRSVADAGRHCPDPPGIGGESPQTMRTVAFCVSLLP